MTEEMPPGVDPTTVIVTDAEPAALAPPSQENPYLEIDGNPEGGWIAQVHTGDEAHVFTCSAPDLDAAKAEVMRLYAEATKDAGRVKVGGGAIHYGDAKEADGASSAA